MSSQVSENIEVLGNVCAHKGHGNSASLTRLFRVFPHFYFLSFILYDKPILGNKVPSQIPQAVLTNY